ncbi:MAG: lipoyl(octanoyl) transferase LipB [Cyanobacterium sp. T60_A2020_053]|nr:lipoyl(octanoyl) transferase LipB [Cyanobacterium sp. T60_A2020_053]
MIQVNASSSKQLQIEDLGLISYHQAWLYQKQLLQQRLNDANSTDILLIAEHNPVYTLGTGSTLDNLKFDLKTFTGELYRIERGGEVTYHCPGQIVAYPILNLRHHQQDLHWYLRNLEQVMINLLAIYGVEGKRIQGLTGVWVENEKVGALGIKVKRWITMHGFSFNVNCDLAGFKEIIPCGIKDKGVTKLSHFVENVDIVEVKQNLSEVFKAVFGYE